MKVAIVGVSGFIGSYVRDEALARGHQVTAIVRQPEKITARDPRLHVVKADRGATGWAKTSLLRTNRAKAKSLRRTMPPPCSMNWSVPNTFANDLRSLTELWRNHIIQASTHIVVPEC